VLFKKQTILFGFLWLIASFSNRCLAQESNFQFISSLTDSLLDLATNQILGERPTQVILRGLDDNNINWFFEDRLVELLKRQDIIHIYSEDQIERSHGSENSSVTFQYEVSKLDVKYNKQSGNSNTVKRIAEVSFFLRIIQHTTGAVLLSKNFEATKEGWYKQSQLKEGKKNLLQPILISSITGIIVYLFYGLRSR